MVVAVEIPRRRNVSTRPVTRKEEDEDLRMGDSEAVRRIAELGVSQYATTNESDHISPIIADITS